MYNQDMFGLDDHRYMARETRDVLKTFEEEYGVSLPTSWEICPTCNGDGKHVNPDIDSNGLTREDFDQDPDFAESYFSGMYDVTCYECRGRSSVRVVDTDMLKHTDPEMLELWNEWQSSIHESCAISRAERMMGA